ncbi:alpha/beta fold hydrolase [bacterium]|nr:alpha/beta fold hydrolase [bacterium]
MKTLFIAIIGLLLSAGTHAQSIEGSWHGAITIAKAELPLVFHISKTATGYSSTMDSPKQGAFDLECSSTTFSNDSLTIIIDDLKAEYTGVYDAESHTFKGIFKQRMMHFDMELSQSAAEEEVSAKHRPQEPVPPYPYYSEDVTFENKVDGITLAGTLTMPKKRGKFPAVVLISGSGPQNRDEELLGHKPFLVIADYLTKQGYAVLRYDDRGTAKSGGDFASANSNDLSHDAEAAFNFLKARKGITKVGLAGHSEGGFIAPMVAARNPKVDFIILLAGPGMPGGELLLLQQELIGKANHMSESEIETTHELNEKAFEIMNQASDLNEAKSKLHLYFSEKLKELPDSLNPNGMNDEAVLELIDNQYATPWMYYFIRSKPAEYLSKVHCPVLALNGSKDLQVPAKQNLEGIKNALAKAGNNKVTIEELPNLNHLFQNCESGSPSEYASIEETFSPNALKAMSDWLKKVL